MKTRHFWVDDFPNFPRWDISTPKRVQMKEALNLPHVPTRNYATWVSLLLDTPGCFNVLKHHKPVSSDVVIYTYNAYVYIYIYICTKQNSPQTQWGIVLETETRTQKHSRSTWHPNDSSPLWEPWERPPQRGRKRLNTKPRLPKERRHESLPNARPIYVHIKKAARKTPAGLWERLCQSPHGRDVAWRWEHWAQSALLKGCHSYNGQTQGPTTMWTHLTFPQDHPMTPWINDTGAFNNSPGSTNIAWCDLCHWTWWKSFPSFKKAHPTEHADWESQ